MIIMQQLWAVAILDGHCTTIPLRAAGVGYKYLLRTCAVTHNSSEFTGGMEDDERDDWIGEEHFSGNFDQLQPNNGCVCTNLKGAHFMMETS